jgi:hypothetical protein
MLVRPVGNKDVGSGFLDQGVMELLLSRLDRDIEKVSAWWWRLPDLVSDIDERQSGAKVRL